MYQKDYILRMIEEMGRFLALLFGLIRKGEYRKASDQLEKMYYDILKEDAAFFRGISEEDLTEELLEKHNYTNGHLEIMAELFNAEAVLCVALKDNAGALSFSSRSLKLFRFIDAEYKTYSRERLNKIEEIEERIKALSP